MADSPEEAGAFFAGGLLFSRFATPEEQSQSSGGGSRRGAGGRAKLAHPERLNAVAVGLLEDGEDERLEERS